MPQTNYKISEAELVAFKKRRYSRMAVQKALKSGEMRKALCCNLCNEKRMLEAHHIDYGQPFSVMWLCSTCHGKAHRKDSPLNPKNNSQSPLPFVGEKYKNVAVTFTIPIENFLALKKESEDTKKTISEILRKEVIKKYPVLNRQLELFEEINDDSQKIIQSGICSMDKNESLLPKQKYSTVSKIRSKRNLNRQRVGEGFPEIYGRNGKDARELQRTFSY